MKKTTSIPAYFPAQLRPLLLALIAAWSPLTQAEGSDAALPEVVVKESQSVSEKNRLPTTTESITADKAADTVNAMNVEDTLKYLPNVLVRKRFIGDTQAPMSTRTTGINAGARSLIYADGTLLSALINNNNGNGSPRWFMVAPEEVERIDVLYGPFAAQYPGNSYGAVTEITTRMPEHFEASVKANTAFQDFSQYGTGNTYRSQEFSATLGNRSGDLSWWFSANHLDSYSQPVTYITAASAPAGSSGAYLTQDRTGKNLYVLGAGNLTHTVQDNAKLKLAYDFSPTLTATYTLGFWQNNADAHAQSYLRNAAGAQVYTSAFSSNDTEQEQWMQSLAVRSKTQGAWDWEAVASNFYVARDVTRTSTGAYPAAQSGGPGTIADAGGTGWNTLDLKGTWRPDGVSGAHVVSFGGHADEYKLVSPTYLTGNWVSGDNDALSVDSRGKTRTTALWAQDVWRLSQNWKATVGGRYEWWKAFDGYNFAAAGGGVNQPEVKHSGFSPKFSLAWAPDDNWQVTGSFGKALRFPTVGELYQNVQVGGIFLQPNPNLKPEKVLSSELAIERALDKGKARVSLFQEEVSDALISQTSTLGSGVASFTQNVDKTRQRGVELVVQKDDALIRGLELNGSVTYVDARILANSSFVSATTTSVGKRTPYVPEWRATLVATYRPDDKWAYTVAGRYSGRLYATVDNSDVNTNTYQGFDSYMVFDARVRYKIDKHWSSAVGIDNITNKDYFLFHPFPQRTLFAELKYDF
ncbi:TonB-dependent receptor [Herbaspirillum sp. RV1423]|uniref:TonB-dependent receptor n=1 Tax=Herbaspirillum sp. RV1423 TaxID=1443993 RepID=UPI0004AEE20B|nr:TonB-dependent receptor [Herbaspirillum sp. RV1423]